MEISEATISVYYAAKLLTLAPFYLRKNNIGSVEIKRSILWSIYSAVIVLMLVFLTYQGLLFDASSKMPIHASFRMKSTTSMVVTVLDVSIVILSAMAGTICGLMNLHSICELNKLLHKIDDFLCQHSYTNLKMDGLSSILMLLPLLIIVFLLGYDMTTWMRFADRMKLNQIDAEVNVQWYIPFYALYMILTGLHCVFANTVYSLGRRYRRLNNMLRKSFLTDKTETEEKSIYKLKHHHKITNVKAISGSTLSTKLKTDQMCMCSPPFHGFTKTAFLRLIAENHASLSKCMSLVSQAYGIAVMFILISCILHLVATAYFLFLELFTKMDGGYICLQVLWILFHTFRLLMVVEPCDMATVESKKTIQIVCEIERDVNDPILMEEIKKLWQQLIVLNGEFSACGLCYVNRSILTSIGSAIATYLVILIQFQKTNG